VRLAIEAAPESAANRKPEPDHPRGPRLRRRRGSAHHTQRTRAQRAAVIDGCFTVQHLTVVVAVGDVLRMWVVLVVVEIPAGDVVGVAIAVIIDTVGALDDQVFGIEIAVTVVIGRTGKSRTLNHGSPLS